MLPEYFRFVFADSSCPAINLNKDLVLDAQLGVSTQYDWAKVTCHTRLPFICAVKVKASEQLRVLGMLYGTVEHVAAKFERKAHTRGSMTYGTCER